MSTAGDLDDTQAQRHPIGKLDRSPGLAFEFGGGRRWYALVGAIEPAAVLHYAPIAAAVVVE